MPLTAVTHALVSAGADEGTRFVALCDACSSPIPLEVAARDLRGARIDLRARGWRERARHGKSREQWAWLCAACASRAGRESRTREREAARGASEPGARGRGAT